MWIRISDPDPQHWFLGYVLFLQRYRIQVLAHHLSPGYLCLLDRVADLLFVIYGSGANIFKKFGPNSEAPSAAFT
jgi:hypothetical protein